MLGFLALFLFPLNRSRRLRTQIVAHTFKILSVIFNSTA